MNTKLSNKIIQDVAEELGIKPKVVKVVIHNFFKTLKTFIRMRFAVKVHGYFRFYPKKKSINNKN